MEDKRFDSLTKAFASGASRRSVLKGLIGLGAAAVTGAVVLDDDGADAATRTTPTPKPPTCPGQQTWNSTLKKCVCPANLSQCVPGSGPSCCNDKAVAPGAPGYSTCCDNACCQGTCTSEEQCCPTNSRAGGLPPTNRVCRTTNGDDCCLYSDECCTIDSCCATTCHGGSDGKSYCCPVSDWCPGGSTSPERCCEGDTVCCGVNTNGNICADLRDDDNNCGACGNKCGGCSSCKNGVCVADDDKCTGTDVCCPKNDSYFCETGPYCGCDADSDCPGTNPATCQAGWCDRGTCRIKAATNTTICHPAGTGSNATCDPAVYCNGESQSCPGAHYAAPGTDCGDCMTCNATGVCVDNCSEGLCCSDDFCADQIGECCASNDCRAPNNCTPPACVEHQCSSVSACTENETCCGSGVEGCVDLNTDNSNCGGCGDTCLGCRTCRGGVCTLDDAKCTVEGEICCPSGANFGKCEAGPYCGCDGNSDCPPCNHCDEGACVDDCAGQQCCPDTETCVPSGEICCQDDLECALLDRCGDVELILGSCNDSGYCVENKIDCDSGDLCTNYFCDPQSLSCASTPVVCNNPPSCSIGPGRCDGRTGKCSYQQVDCSRAPGVCYAMPGVCSEDTCHYSPVDYGVSCGDCLICDGQGGCVADPACQQCGEDGDACDAAPGDQGNCCDFYICNESGVCEGTCAINPTADCICFDTGSCIAAAVGPCCKVAGGSPRRCNNGNGNCFCDPIGDPDQDAMCLANFGQGHGQCLLGGEGVGECQ